MRPPTGNEWKDVDIPHVVMTSDVTWDPSMYDCDPSTMDHSTSTQLLNAEPRSDLWDRSAHVTRCIYEHDSITIYKPASILPAVPDYDSLRPLLGWIPSTRVKDTLSCTTQWYKAENRPWMREHWRSRFPAANLPRRNEKAAMDTIYSDTPAADDGISGHGGCTMLQFYCGCKSNLAHGEPLRSESNIPDTILDYFRKCGVPTILFSDNAKAELSKAVTDILRQYAVEQQTSEPHHQNQNPAERRIQDIKCMTNILLDRTGTPPAYWLLCMLYVIGLLNHVSCPSNTDKMTPIQAAYGYVPDLSKYFNFHWWQRVLYKNNTKSFPSHTYEGIGHFVGIADHCGDVLTFLILTDETRQVIQRSCVRPLDPENPNIRVLQELMADGEDSDETYESVPKVVQSIPEAFVPELDPSTVKLPKFSPEELLGRTFLHDTADGERVRAEIVRKIEDKDAENHKNIKFLVNWGCDLNDQAYEEIMLYNELSDLCEHQDKLEMEDPERLHTYKQILDHEGPLKQGHTNYKGSMWNVKVQWDDGTITWEPLTIIAKDDPAGVAQYTIKKELLHLPGWKRFKRLSKCTKKMTRMVKQAIMASKHHGGPIFMFGIQVPRNHKEAVELDNKNGNRKWQDAEDLELDQLDEYETFNDIGKRRLPRNYRYIKVFIIYAVKHDGRHKARLVAGGHLTPASDSAYSSVVSLRGLRLAIAIGELNGLKCMVGDVGNAYLEAYTKELVGFVAGPEFGDCEGHTLIIVKALYGLRSSGRQWAEKFADTMRDMGFQQCKNGPRYMVKGCRQHI